QRSPGETRATAVLPMRGPHRRPEVGRRRKAGSWRLRHPSRRQQVAPVGPRSHFVARYSHYELAVLSYLPAPPERTVDGGGTKRHVAQRYGPIAFVLKKILLRHQNSCVTHRTG